MSKSNTIEVLFVAIMADTAQYKIVVSPVVYCAAYLTNLVIFFLLGKSNHL